jgi:hypothetical protein
LLKEDVSILAQLPGSEARPHLVKVRVRVRVNVI